MHKDVATGSVIVRISLSLSSLRTSAVALRRMSGGKPRISNVKPSARDRNKPAVRSVADQKNSARRRIRPRESLSSGRLTTSSMRPCSRLDSARPKSSGSVSRVVS